jgi:cytochrome bd ubiquinol oxidase subunit II
MALQVTWFAIWGLLWAVYFMLDGFDFGVGMLRSFLAGDETQKRVALLSVGPVWDGNEVWLVTAGGATFAAFPAVYASMFSFLYLPMLLILFSLIGRGAAIELRDKHDGARWRSVWDWVLAVTSLTAPLVLGLGFGNIFKGLRFDATGYHGTFFGLFNGYGLFTALLFIVLFLQHGALWLATKTRGELASRARTFAGRLWIVVLAVAAVFLVVTWLSTGLKENYLAHPVLFLVPAVAVLALVAVRLLLPRERLFASFIASCATIVAVVATALVGLFPNLIPSSMDAAASLTITNGSSSAYTLKLMTIVVAIFVPIVVVYQILVYRFFRATVGAEDANAEGGY